MKIRVDTRETKPLEFPQKEVEGVERLKLDVGDYALVLPDGNLAPLIFERKGKGDLFGTLGKGHDRFRREAQRAIDKGITLVIIVECSLLSVLQGHDRSRVSGVAVAKTLFTLWVKYGIIPVFCKNREEMSNFIYGTFMAISKAHSKKEKKCIRESTRWS